MKKLFVLLLFSWSIVGIAQLSLTENNDYLIRSFELPDGPSGNSINSIVQGPNEFLWFGGHAGLYRYDGYQFKTYQSNPDDPQGMDFAYIEYLYWSSDGYLWIGTFGGGLYRFDPSDDSFVRFEHDPDDDASLSNNRVTAILEESENILWVGTVDGLNRLDRNTGKFNRFLNDPQDSSSLSDSNIRKLYIDSQGTLWVGTGFIFDARSRGGLNRFNPESHSFTRYLHRPGDPKSLMGDIIKSIYEDSQGTFWVGGAGGLHKMDRENGTFERMKDHPDRTDDVFAPGIRDEKEQTVVYDLLEDNEKNLWVFSLHNAPAGVLGSIGLVDLVNNRMEILEERKLIVPWQAMQSRDGSIWLAGAGVSGRVHQIVPGNSQIQYLPLRSSEDFTFQGLVRSNDSTIWGKAISEDGTVQLIGVRDDNFKNYGIRSLHEVKTSRDTSTESFFRSGGTGLVKDSRGRIWGCTGFWNGGLFSLHPEQPEAYQYLHDPDNQDSPASNMINYILKGQDGTIWMAGINFISGLNPETGKYRHFRHDPENPASLRAGSYLTLFEDRDGYIWGAGVLPYGGSFMERLNPETGIADKLMFPPELQGRHIISITQNLKGDILYLFHGVGLKRLFSEVLKTPDWNEDYIGETVLEDSFLDANNLILDNEGIFWLTNEEGKIFRFDSETQSTIEFTDQLGLEFTLGAAFKLDDGSLYFNYQNGLAKILPTDKKSDGRSNNSKPHFTEFRLNGQQISGTDEEFLKNPIWSEELILLPHNQSNFSLRFSSFDFKYPDKSRYQVRLLPLESDWRTIEGDPTVNYFQLPPGDYTLEVKGSDSNGVWSEETAKLEISIAPPWWRSWWAYSLYGLAVLLIGFQVHRYQKARTIRQEREKIREQELAQAREIEKAYTQLKQTQNQLIQSEKMASLGELTAGIAHEIQNPLNFVNNFSEVSRELIEELLEELKKGDAQEVDAIAKDVIQNLEKILHHGKRADSIVKGMLQHSRSGDGKKEPTDLNALSDEYLRLAYHGLRAKEKSFNAVLETDFDDSIDEVEVVPQEIGRVLLNLITNAFHAVNEQKEKEGDEYEPTVRVQTRKTEKGVEISVRDNGSGIPEAIRDKIFQPFFTTKPTGEGTGLGLSMSYDIVTKGHGGTLRVQTNAGTGSEFIITLPV